MISQFTNNTYNFERIRICTNIRKVMNRKRNKTYDRVMSRVFNHSRTTLQSNSCVTRHESPSSVQIGAKASTSNVSSGIYSELPLVLKDYVPESSGETVQKSKVVKPRRTLKSMDTSKSPHRTVFRNAKSDERPRMIRVPDSTPAVVRRMNEDWSDLHVKQCFSSKSHSKLKEIKVS